MSFAAGCCCCDRRHSTEAHGGPRLLSPQQRPPKWVVADDAAAAAVVAGAEDAAAIHHHQQPHRAHRVRWSQVAMRWRSRSRSLVAAGWPFVPLAGRSRWWRWWRLSPWLWFAAGRCRVHGSTSVEGGARFSIQSMGFPRSEGQHVHRVLDAGTASRVSPWLLLAIIRVSISNSRTIVHAMTMPFKWQDTRMTGNYRGLVRVPVHACHTHALECGGTGWIIVLFALHMY